ncbi:MAG TPA: FKBP-type peptidyl-prolyl cis-trans isomerase [Conexibacter sp.]|nr:FKBP-type peptidyl-prolyl cis-trans isomerase [Conexibacter sp.]
MRVLLCCAAIAVTLVIVGCGGDSNSSSDGDQAATSGTSTTQTAPAQRILHYITREAKPRNPGPHPGARVDQLIVRDIRKGVGPAIRAGDSGIFEFIATNWVTGRPLEESWHRRRPFETQVEKNVVIDGWWQGIPGMRVSGRRQIVIPPSLGFTTNPELQNATTFFDVVLVEIRPQQPRGLAPPSGQESAPSIG